MGFYKGIVPNLLRGIPQRGLYFYSYEILKSFICIDLKEKKWLSNIIYSLLLLY